MSEMRNPRSCCGGCKFWENNGGDVLDEEHRVHYGHCRRHPPVFVPNHSDDGGIGACRWPTTRTDQWCGEHQFRAGDPRI